MGAEEEREETLWELISKRRTREIQWMTRLPEDIMVCKRCGSYKFHGRDRGDYIEIVCDLCETVVTRFRKVCEIR